MLKVITSRPKLDYATITSKYIFCIEGYLHQKNKGIITGLLHFYELHTHKDSSTFTLSAHDMYTVTIYMSECTSILN